MAGGDETREVGGGMNKPGKARNRCDGREVGRDGGYRHKVALLFTETRQIKEGGEGELGGD